jgi:hypothetical protein
MEIIDRIEGLFLNGKIEFVYENNSPLCGIYPARNIVLVSVFNNKGEYDSSLVDVLDREFFRRDLPQVVPTTRIDALVNPSLTKQGLAEFVALYKEAVYSLFRRLKDKRPKGGMIGAANITDAEAFHRVAQIRSEARWYALSLLNENAWIEVESMFSAGRILGKDTAKVVIAAINEFAGF